MKSGVLDPASCAGATPSSINGPCADAYYAVYGATKATATTANRDAVAGDFFAKATATGMANTCIPATSRRPASARSHARSGKGEGRHGRGQVARARSYGQCLTLIGPRS